MPSGYTEIRVGISATSFSGEHEPETQFGVRPNFTGGVAFGYTFYPGLSIQPEILYSVKGAQLKEGVTYRIVSQIGDEDPVYGTTDVKGHFRIAYLEIPVLLVYTFERSKLAPRVFIGPALALNAFLGLKLEAISSIEAREGSAAPLLEDDTTVKDRDLGMVIGLGTSFHVHDQHLTLGLRTTIGMVDITHPFEAPNDSFPVASNDHNRRNITFALFAGLRL